MQNNQMKNTEGTYGDKYKDHFFEQYKIYLQGIEKISDRRENANKYFVTINSGIIVALSYLSQHFNNIFVIPAMLSVLILGIVLSVIFYFLINSYKQLNSGKFLVLHKMEESLPIQMYSDEWKALGEGRDCFKYFPFSHIERIIPVVFGIAYIGALIYVCNIFCVF
jgi:NhaP-type Na+/H+ or K+/H+ antiporter